MRRMTTKISAFESPDLGALSRNLKQNFPTLENFLGVSEVAEFNKKMSKISSQIHLEILKFDLRFCSFFTEFCDFRGP